METVVDIVGNEEARVQDITLQKTADPVVYQLVRVHFYEPVVNKFSLMARVLLMKKFDDNGELVPATDDEVMAVEDLLEDDNSKGGTPDTGRTLECSTSYGCGPCGSDKVQFNGSEGQSQVEELEVGPEKPRMPPNPAMDFVETDSQHEERIPSLIPNASDDSLDILSVKDLQETFKATFGRETSVKDKQWLKRRIIMGLTNSCDFSTTTFVIIDNRVVKKGREETCKTADCPVLVDCVVRSAMESHEGPSTSHDKHETHAIANGMQIRSSTFQENCGSKDADTEQRPAKRVRKPTKRYIEELSEGESRDSGDKIVSLVKHPANDQPSAKVCARPVQDFELDGRCLTRKDSLGGSGIQVPYVSRIRRSRPRENFMTLMPSDMGISSVLEKDGVESSEQLDKESGNEVLKNSLSPRWIQEPFDGYLLCLLLLPKDASLIQKKNNSAGERSEAKYLESYKTSSDDEVATVPTANGGMRRKHHRPWSLSEVVKLVEGVAKYGAGRWSEIKRLAFASYSYRTSVDLKDKWRNLLRASLAELPTGNGMPSSRKQASVPIPAPILSRVRELADVQTQVLPSFSSGRLAGFNDSNNTVHETSPGFL
ncbi:hypothetical protein DH2020_048196 [Rehmannia glutinosa]|uniref:Telomere repeat-binding factor like-protein n=1 Tax=Rehmannia glutinosa TaxID=99300 RepID=A0ABR0U6W6_REHGL